jgi:hypothetical protein
MRAVGRLLYVVARIQCQGDPSGICDGGCGGSTCFFFPYIGFSLFPSIDHLGMGSGCDSTYGSKRVSPHHDFNVENSELLYTSGLREWASIVFWVVLQCNIPDFSALLYNFPKLSAPLYIIQYFCDVLFNLPKFAFLLYNIPISKHNLTFMLFIISEVGRIKKWYHKF